MSKSYWSSTFRTVKLCNFVLTRILLVGHQEHRATVGRAAHERGLHRDWANHGMGQQGHRDQECGDWTPGWGLHAQEGAKTEISVRKE